MKKWYEKPVQSVDTESIRLARDHQSILTKPLGSLGRLEEIAEKFAGWQSTVHPKLNKIKVGVFAGDHGICAQGVSAFPQEVTAQMISNFLEGGAAISVLSRDLNAEFHVINMGIVSSLPKALSNHSQLMNVQLDLGTADFSVNAAMTYDLLEHAMTTGKSYVDEFHSIDLFIGGEMGIGNTSSASAIYAALLSLSSEDVVGPGTGLDSKGMNHKSQVVSQGLSLHQDYLGDPYQVLRCLGGLEIAGLTAAYIACAQRGIPVLVDGFICTAAALVAVSLNKGVKDWLLFSHESAEPAHRLALEHLQVSALLNLGMRLGEGSGAAVAVPLIKSALSLHNNMATFAQAGVSGSDDRR
jgi:nicotinate-nucleotide--dimethylbenzimidazole phosphoribosyltransferase